jgi:hypothetical protein
MAKLQTCLPIRARREAMALYTLEVTKLQAFLPISARRGALAFVLLVEMARHAGNQA